MLIKKLTIDNWASFHGTNTINLMPNEDENIVLILASNNSGKTNIIRAIKFLFYGYIPENAEDHTVLNNLAFEKLNVNDLETASVDAKINHGNKAITIRRRVTVERLESGKRKTIENSMQLIEHAANTDQVIEDLDLIKDKINKIIPLGLFDYLFMRGEELRESLEQGAQELADGIATIIQRKKWEQAEKAVMYSIRQIDTKLTKLSEIDNELKQAQEKESRLKGYLEKDKIKYNKIIAEIDALTNELNKIENDLKNYTFEKNDDQKLNKERSTIKKDIENTERKAKELDKEKRESIGESRGLCFIKGAFEPACETLSKLNAENLLPPDITPGFINRLCSKGKCICGEQLLEGTRSYDNVQNYLINSISKNLSMDLTRVHSLLEDTKYGYANRIKETNKKFSQIDKDKRNLVGNEMRLNAKLENVEKDLRDLKSKGYERYKSDLDKQKQLQRTYEEAIINRTQIEGDIEKCKFEWGQAERKLKLITKQKGNTEFKELMRKKEKANSLLTLINSTWDMLKKSFHKPLLDELRQKYDSNVTDNTKADVDPITLRPYIIQNDNRVVFKGGGQGQLLTIGYVLALTKLKNLLNDTLNAMGLKAYKRGDQCLFMDSILAPTDQTYRRIISAFLANSGSRQVVLLLTQEQWGSEVRQGLENYVDVCYKILFRRDKIDPNDEERNDARATYKENAIDLVEWGQPNVYSTLEKVG